LGNLIGRIAHKQGFKYGHNGLWYVLRDPEDSSRVIKEIRVTLDIVDSMQFMGYEPEQYMYYWDFGFNSMEDIFTFVSRNMLFNKDIYLLQSRNHHARVRDKKRKTYMAFLKWCEGRDFEWNYNWEIDKDKKRAQFLEYAFLQFPEFKKEYDEALNKHQRSKVAKSKFNGNLVTQLTGLEGKELGQFIAQFKKSWFYDEHFWHYILRRYAGIRCVPSTLTATI